MLRRNVLIFHSGALGDFVLSWPLALALGRIYAQSRIIYVTASQKGALAERALRIECTDVEAGWHTLFAPDAQPPGNVLKFLQGAHAIFSFVANDESPWAANVRRLTPQAKTFFIDPNPPPGFAEHATVHLLNQLSHDPVVSTALAQMLKSIQDRGIGVSRSAGGPVVLHPGAGAAEKCWPLDRFIELTRKLRESNQEVRVLLGEVELDRWSEADRRAFDGLANLVGPQNLIELFSQLTQASLVIGNDSGPAHLAGIAGVPTIALFGPTDPAVWKPLGPKVRVIRGETMNAITVEEALCAATQ